MPAANRASIETVDIGRGNHYEPRNSHFKPSRRSSTLRSDEWDSYDRRYDRYDDYRPRYEEVDVYERPGKSVSYQDNYYDDTGRWQASSGPIRHYVSPPHPHRGAQSQVVGVRPRPVYYDDERIVPPVRLGPRRVPSKATAPAEHTEASKTRNESQHVPGLFQTVFDVNHPQDASVHLELPITDDHDAELEEFCRLQRLGNFGAAEDYFKNKLEPYLSKPYVFVQFGQMLLEKGDYLAFERLNPEAVFGREDPPPTRVRERVVVVERDRSRPRVRSRSRSWSRSRERRRETRARSRSRSPVEDGRQERRARFESDVRIVRRSRSRSRSRSVDKIQRYYERDRYAESDRSSSTDGEGRFQDTEPNPDYELELLRQNWRLLKATSLIHSKGNYEDAFTEAWNTIDNSRFGTGIGSTEARICLFPHLVVVADECYRFRW